MIYVSLNYFVLVLCAMILYYIVPLKHRWIVLFMADIAFYFIFYRIGWWIFSGTIVLAYLSGLLLNSVSGKRKKVLLVMSILALILPWGLIKNTNFIVSDVFGKDPIHWITPLGISFYTLQLVSYIADIYCNKIAPEKNIFRFALYASFFPQIIQGPISRFSQLGHQLFEGHKFNETKVVTGFHYIIWGFFLKLVIADKAAVIVNTVFDHDLGYSGGYIWIASILYSIQLYTDFLACTTLAQGVSKLFGVEIIDNFARPYFSTSIQDFWRRWHISLSSWLRDYIYIPLGGKRKGKARKYLNLIITFLISGLWHGSGFKFLVWGMMHAAYQILGDVTGTVRKKAYTLLKISGDSKGRIYLKQIVTFLLVNWAWIIFRADSLWIGLRMIKHMVTEFNPWIFFDDSIFMLGLEWKEVMVLILAILLLFKVGRIHESGASASEIIMKCSLPIRWGIYIGAILVIMVFGTYGYGFHAQDFIYGGF